MRHLKFSLCIALFLAAVGCQKDAQPPAPEQDPAALAQQYAEEAQAKIEEGGEPLNFRGPTISVPAGSVDALQDAVDAAGPNGTVLLESGLHTESGAVTLTEPVRVSGESGAVVEFDTEGQDFPFEGTPAFHVLQANNVVIENLTIRDSDNSGGIAVLLQESDRCRVQDNDIAGFELGVTLYDANSARIYDNLIDGEIALFGLGIVSISGKDLKIYNNTLTDHVIGLFVSDDDGVALNNHISGAGNVGLLLCTPNIFGAYLVLPDGRNVAAEIPANNWLIISNYAEGYNWNFMVSDNANGNTLIRNRSGESNIWDMELVGVTDRFGPVTPPCFDNFVYANPRSDMTIKDCGTNNTVIGGVQVDTNQFPCD
jgi:hypothetical protein